MVLRGADGLADQGEAECLAFEVRTDRPVAGLQEGPEQRLVAGEEVAVGLNQFDVAPRPADVASPAFGRSWRARISAR